MIDRLGRVTHLGPKQNGHKFADDVFKYVFLMSLCSFKLQFRQPFKITVSPIDNDNSAMDHVMVGLRIGNKPLPEQMLINFHDSLWRH